MLANLSARTKRILLVVLSVLVTLFIVFAFSGSGDSIDIEPEEGSSLDLSSQAYVQGRDDEELYRLLGGSLPYNSLASDLHTFAKQTIDTYKQEPDRVVGFLLSGKLEKSGKDVTFKGRYGAIKDTIEVKVTLLNNSRIHTSIKNTKTGQSIDDQLPSNSKENQFVGSLPIKNDLFWIEYNKSVNSFTITAVTPDPDTRQKATDLITSSLNKDKSELKILYKPYLY